MFEQIRPDPETDLDLSRKQEQNPEQTVPDPQQCKESYLRTTYFRVNLKTGSKICFLGQNNFFLSPLKKRLKRAHLKIHEINR